MMRAALLGAAGNQRLARFVTKHGKRFGAYRFVAGVTIDEFMEAVKRANAAGFCVASGLLGEDVTSAESAREAAGAYVVILQRLAAQHADANVALKLTHLGLAIDRELAYANVRLVCGAAAATNNFVRIDMEQSAYTDATLEIYRRLRADGVSNVGTVLQAYLYRTNEDLDGLLPLRPNLRLVKGAYLEPAAIAFPEKHDVDANYFKLISTSLKGGGFTAIATHDAAIIEQAIAFAEAHGVARESFEFQMLYGVRPSLQKALLAKGYRVRIAIPFGAQWYPYFMRRLAERPANVFFFLSSLWRG
jgi:proline dehydrogenase